MSRLLIRNGRVVDPSQAIDQDMDVLLVDGLVEAVGAGLDVSADTPVLEASGHVVAPGFIDLAAHLCEPGYEHKETIATGCLAAVAGGFTAVCSTADTDPVNDDPSVTRFIREQAEDVDLARVFPLGAVTRNLNGEELAEIGEMTREGIVAVGDAGRPITNSLLMRRALEYARSFDIPVAVHPEDPGLSDRGLMHESAVSTRIGLRGMPSAAETVVIARDLALANATRGRLHIRHVSTAAGFALIRTAKDDGVRVTCDVAPYSFCLTDEDVAGATYDPNWKTNPPMRSAEDVDAVKQALRDGTVDAIVSDHQPHHQDDKELDFSEAPFGIVGLETTVSLAIDRLLRTEVLDFARLVQLLSTGPAQTFRLPGGSLKRGEPGDVTILDLDHRTTVDPARFQSKSRNTPFGGWELSGAPVATIVGGRIVWHVQD